MANHFRASGATLALAIGVSALVGACATNNGPAVQVVDETAGNQLQDQYNEVDFGQAVVVPRLGFANALAEDAPERYIVVKGDTLWDISERFLTDPWLWPSIWNYNPQIADPHWIYPGDQIALEYINGQPSLVIERDGRTISVAGGSLAGGSLAGGSLAGRSLAGRAAPAGLKTERFSPRIREESLEDAIPTIPGDAINSFLVHPRVVPSAVLEGAPYVVGNFDRRLTSAAGHQIYVRGELSRDQPHYAVFRQTKALRDPINNALLGYEVQHVSDVKLMHLGDPSTLTIVSNNMETIAGDILLPTNEDPMTHHYVTRMPKFESGQAQIISLVNSISQSGRSQVVVLNIGEESSIQVGDVLAVETRGESRVDPRGKGGFERIKMPNTRTGVVLVFKTFDKVSYALVMESTLPVRVNDIVTGI